MNSGEQRIKNAVDAICKCQVVCKLKADRKKLISIIEERVAKLSVEEDAFLAFNYWARAEDFGEGKMFALEHADSSLAEVAAGLLGSFRGIEVLNAECLDEVLAVGSPAVMLAIFDGLGRPKKVSIFAY